MSTKLYLVLALTIACCSTANATTYYIREDGGTTTECVGSTDAPYPGSGSSQACAWNHPYWAIPPTSGTKNISAGDTLIINSTTGAGYQMGIADGNSHRAERNANACDEAFAFDCFMQTVPSGIDINNRTKIYGQGWDTGCANPPELWGSGRTQMILNLGGSDHLDIRCLEVTDRHAGVAPGGDGHPNSCRGSFPYTQNSSGWEMGVKGNGNTNVKFQDIYIHGLCRDGMRVGNADNWDLDGVVVQGNGWAGWSADVAAGDESLDNISIDTSKFEWTGCVEEYPIVNSDVQDRMTNCQDPFGDGFGQGNGSCGTITINDSSFSYNSSDGLDLLHCTGGQGVDSVNIKRSLFSSNAGAQLKVGGGMNMTVEDSVIIGACNYFSESGKVCSFSDCGGFNHCRANGDVIAATFNAGTEVKINNSTIVSEGGSIFLVQGNQGSGSCDGTEVYEVSNSIILGEEFAIKTPAQKTNLFYNCGSPGEQCGEGGSCDDNGANPIPFTLTDIYAVNLRDGAPAGTNVVYGTDPDITNVTVVQTGTGSITPADIDDWLINDGMKPKTGTAIIGLSDETYTPSDSLDYYNQERGAAWDLGALEFSTGSAPVCGNNTTETGETCDGTDINSKDCTNYLGGGEAFDGGTLACESNCLAYDTSACTLAACGNGAIDTGEDCDTTGPLLNGQTCVTQGFASGSLACTANTCLFDTSSCVAHVCQDGIVAPTGEECDDGNSVEGDGCSSICENENSNFELLLTYSETDPSSNLTVNTHIVGFNSISRDVDAKLQTNKGAGNIGDFSYDYQLSVESCFDLGLDAITLDDINQPEDSDDNDDIMTFSHTVPSGNNRILIVSLTAEGIGSETISSVTFGGSALTLAVAGSSINNHAYIYYILSPDVSTANIVTTWSGNVQGVAGAAQNFTNVAQQSPEVISTSTDQAVIFTPLTKKSLGIGVLNVNSSGATVSTINNEIHNFANPGSHVQGVSFVVVEELEATSLPWQISTTNYNMSAAVFAPSSSTSTISKSGFMSVSSAVYADLTAQDTGEDGSYILLECNSAFQQTTITLTSVDGGSTNTDSYVINNLPLEFWGNIERSSTTLTNKVYSDSTRTTLDDTQTVTTTSTTHQYFTPYITYNDSVTGTNVGGAIGNIDLSSGSSPAPSPAIESIVITGTNLTISFP